MDPHAHVQAEFDQYSEERVKENIVTGNYIGIAPDANLFSSSSSTEPASVIPVTTITDAPIGVAPMDATVIPAGDISAAAIVPPGQVSDPAGGDCCGDCGDCSGGDCGGGDRGGGDCGGGGCTIM